MERLWHFRRSGQESRHKQRPLLFKVIHDLNCESNEIDSWIDSRRILSQVHASPDRMKKIPETNASMVRCGRICPTLLRMNAVNTKSNDTMGKGVAVLTISETGQKKWIRRVENVKSIGYVGTCDVTWLNSLRMFAVFSVVISISGSVKYSDATHFPFSDPKKHQEKWRKELRNDSDHKGAHYRYQNNVAHSLVVKSFTLCRWRCFEVYVGLFRICCHNKFL